tara:strand:- start:347 stop:547 length:201 start_codon:yes stop_codon:yes gene_type:complete
MINVTKVKNKFHDNGLQITTTAINMIRDDFNRKLDRMISRCKDGNVKRLSDKTYHISIGILKDFLK